MPSIVTKYRPLAPTTPTKYFGEEDPMCFFKYVMQCKRFVQEAMLGEEAQIPHCADFLEGKAYKYYTTTVSMDVDNDWTLAKNFTGLYDYCFPPNFRLHQWHKLDTFQQWDMPVTEYAAELSLLFRLVGMSTEQVCIDKLGNRLWLSLQTVLWKEGLDFKANSWEDVVTVATKHKMEDHMEATYHKGQPFCET